MSNSVHIEISGTAQYRLAGQVRSLIDSVRAVSNQASTVLAICNAFLGPNPVLTDDASYSDLAIALGLSGANANRDAHNFYTLLTLAQGRLTGNQISNFVDQLG